MEVTSGKGNQVPLWHWMLSKLRYPFLEPYQMVEIVGIPIFEGLAEYFFCDFKLEMRV